MNRNLDTISAIGIHECMYLRMSIISTSLCMEDVCMDEDHTSQMRCEPALIAAR